IGGEGECARYWRCRHHEHVGAGATFLRQHQALMDAEARLLSRNSKRESPRGHGLLKEGMGAAKHIHAAIRCGAENILALLSFLRQHQALMDAEAMLLIHNSKRESLKGHVFLKEGMGADKNIHFAIRCGAENILALLSFLPAREKRKTHTRHLAEWLQGCEMLT